MNQKITKVRKPRVHITFEVEGSDGDEKKELPFVVGVLGDYSGDNKSELKPIKERKFVEVDADTFATVMDNMKPGVQLKVDNHLSDEEDAQMAVDLSFNKMEDFEPEGIAKQVPALKNLLDTRDQLRDLLSKADRSDELEALLEKILQDSDTLNKFSDELTNATKEEA